MFNRGEGRKGATDDDLKAKDRPPQSIHDWAPFEPKGRYLGGKPAACKIKGSGAEEDIGMVSK